MARKRSIRKTRDLSGLAWTKGHLQGRRDFTSPNPSRDSQGAMTGKGIKRKPSSADRAMLGSAGRLGSGTTARPKKKAKKVAYQKVSRRRRK